MKQRIIVVGGGIGGLAAARDLAGPDTEVVLFESGPTVGGLVEGFSIVGTPLERFYHYLLPQEVLAQELIDELGLGDRLEWFTGSIGILTGGKVWPFTSPLDLIRFGPLTLLNRVRAGIGALRLKRVKEWRELDEVSAADWLTGLTSPEVTQVVWNPLLRAKFGPAAPKVPAAWMWGRLDQRQQARKGSGEQVAYLRGGFGLMFAALADDLRARGVKIRTGSAIDEIVVSDGKVSGVRCGDEIVEADSVLFCGTLPAITRLLPTELCDRRWLEAKGLGAMCVIMDLPRALTPVFWTNVCDDDLPFGGIIEHTNLVPTSWYSGRHVVYLSRYFTADEAVATEDVQEEAARWIKALAETFPDFSADEIGEMHAFRTQYAAPLVTFPYLDHIPPVESHIPGLFLSTTGQIYPQDRGMHEGIRRSKIAAAVVAGRAWTCPVCGSHDAVEAFALTGDATEGGVDPEAFRPSSDEYGTVVGTVLRCANCGHAAVDEVPVVEQISDAYADASDPVSLREEAGQMATAAKALPKIDALVPRGRMLDVGCWTGSFLAAAKEQGWEPVGVEPSVWASARARERGLVVHTGELADIELPNAHFSAIVCCDVLEHLVDPGPTLARFAELLHDNGVLYLTVPDAGSRLARLMGKRWWAIVPMHLQYFTRTSMRLLLEEHGFEVRNVATHPKTFTLRYYAERMASFVPFVGKTALAAVEHAPGADHLVAPDFGDRMEVVAVRRSR